MDTFWVCINRREVIQLSKIWYLTTNAWIWSFLYGLGVSLGLVIHTSTYTHSFIKFKQVGRICAFYFPALSLSFCFSFIYHLCISVYLLFTNQSLIISVCWPIIDEISNMQCYYFKLYLWYGLIISLEIRKSIIPPPSQRSPLKCPITN